jgi:gamma-glutamyltranspeptidase / glutathione hydrolase
MYLDADGEVVPRASIDGPLAAGIPGLPAALAHIAARYGRLPLDVSLYPAIALAEDGFPVDAHYRRMAGDPPRRAAGLAGRGRAVPGR